MWLRPAAVKSRRALGGALIVLSLVRGAAAQPRPSEDLTGLTLEQLMDIEVTSASKKREALARSPAALYVITREDIRRAGATSLAEALRLAPGLEVARINSNQWAISARGFNGRFANKLLTLVDGRTVYTPLFSGVYWETLDTLLSDVDRIEVIRGPGAALWGANAVNGVINIITRTAEETAGGAVNATVGNEERFLGAARYGGALGKDAHYRVFAKYTNRDAFADAEAPAGDAWHGAHAGFRADRRRGKDTFTLQGDVHADHATSRITVPSLLPPTSEERADVADLSGIDVLGRFARTLPSGAEVRAQLYYDATDNESSIYRESRHTVDLDLQHRFHLGKRQDIVWGAGYRLSRDALDGSFALSFSPRTRDLQLASAFVQDEVTIVPDRLQLRAGTRVERQELTGLLVQPTLRALYTPHPHHTLWGAVSRALRTPSRAEEDVRINLAVQDGALIAGVGSRSLKSEKLMGLELGYRLQSTARSALDMAAFWNDYRGLRTAEPDTPFLEADPAPAHLVLPLRADNRLDGRTYGLEVSADLSIASRLKVRAGYAFLHMSLEGRASSDSTLSSAEGHVPRHQGQLRAYFDLGRAWQLDAGIYGVGRLADPDFAVPAYARVDGRAAWLASPRITVSAQVQNALSAAHREFGPSTFVTPSDVQRSVFATVAVRF
jgi:iron complex outermembrane receptor protein